MLKNKLRKEEFKKLQRNQYDFLSLLLGVKICSTKFIKWIKEFIKELNNVTKSWENGFQKLFVQLKTWILRDIDDPKLILQS